MSMLHRQLLNLDHRTALIQYSWPNIQLAGSVAYVNTQLKLYTGAAI